MTKTFLKITNKDIYNKLEELIKSNQSEHQELKNHILVTNGKVKLNRWIASTAIMFSVAILGVFKFR